MSVMDQSIPTAASIEVALVKRLFRSETKLIQNDARGDWAEELVGQVLGSPWRIVSGGWHPWDLECGPSNKTAPERIRIQVRNSAAVQMWPQPKAGQASFTIQQRKRPFYFDWHNKGVPCEDFGHLCEIYVLAWHGEKDPAVYDQRDPLQWKFYVVAARDLPLQKRISGPRLEKLFPGSLVGVHNLKARVGQICADLGQATT